jgi:TPR repeat protein/uncharacterized RDD family membrane protein YckC
VVYILREMDNHHKLGKIKTHRFKIGESTRSGKIRAEELTKEAIESGSNASYEFITESRTQDCYRSEQLVFKKLEGFRLGSFGEWGGNELFEFIDESKLQNAIKVIRETCAEVDDQLNQESKKSEPEQPRKIRTHYDNLKVAHNAPDAVIRASYKALIQTYHPDKFEGVKQQESEQITKIIRGSYDVLIDPVQRAEHDAWIKAQETQSRSYSFEQPDINVNSARRKEQTDKENTIPENIRQKQKEQERENFKQQEQAKVSHHPWRRLFARLLDLAIFGGVFGFALIHFVNNVSLNQALQNVISASLIVCLLFVPVEALLLSEIGTTPAKLLFGISLRASDGRSLSFEQAIKRSILVYIKGICLGFPVFFWVTSAFAYYGLNKNGEASWDISTETVVTHKKWGTGQAVVCSMVTVLMLVLTGKSMDEKRAYRPPTTAKTEQIPVAPVVENTAEDQLLYALDLTKKSRFDDALPILEALVQSGDPKAQLYLAYMFFCGIGVDKNYQIAAELYQKAATQGHAIAQFELGMLYADGLGVQKSYGSAANWLNKSASQGHLNAKNALADLYSNLNTLEHQTVKWMPLEISKINYNVEFGLTQKAAYNGNIIAQYNLGIMYLNGFGVTKNETTAAQWFNESANRGYIQAQYSLGIMYLNGFGVTKNETTAAHWFQIASDKEYVPATYNLAWMYSSGAGVPLDIYKGSQLFQKAANLGDIQSIVKLGLIYFTGQGMQQSDYQAVDYFQKAAKKGNSISQYYLGWMLENGRGIEKNDILALDWYKKSASQGNTDAQESIDRLSRQIKCDSVFR